MATKVAKSKTEEDEDLTYEESEIRLIGLLSIFATCLLILATAFVLIVFRLYGLYVDPRMIDFQSERKIGFPLPMKLLMAPSGYLLTYSFTQNKIYALPGLKKFSMKNHETRFAYEESGSIFFLSTDSEKNVVQYNIKDQSHRQVKNSQIPQHLSDFWTYGFRVQNMFWVIKGTLKIKKKKWRIGTFLVCCSLFCCFKKY